MDRISIGRLSPLTLQSGITSNGITSDGIDADLETNVVVHTVHFS